MRRATFVGLVLVCSGPLAQGKTYTVAIDVGHTRASPGAISVTGKPEYDFNRRLAEKLEGKLRETNREGGAAIVPFIISSDNSMTLVARTKIAASRNADLFVSIHHDSAQDKYLEKREVNGQEQRFTEEFSGYSVFVSRKNPQYEESLDLAKRIGLALRRDFPFARHHHEPIAGENRPYADEAAGIYAFDDLIVLKTATMPAVLVECGVIVNPKEERELLTDARQATTVAAIVRGIREHLGRTSVSQRVESADVIETSSPSPAPSPSRYPKPGATVFPAGRRAKLDGEELVCSLETLDRLRADRAGPDRLSQRLPSRPANHARKFQTASDLLHAIGEIDFLADQAVVPKTRHAKLKA
ncbi:MAG: N-acetylmuramoyl-L-alanine amidase, partial [Verrucomicrobiota bacterium]|nr:N-acetylmuramoyl-L-alanine amidase [Verrucomicrobiota bacterium]